MITTFWCIALAMSGSYSSVLAETTHSVDFRAGIKGDTKIDLKRFSSQEMLMAKIITGSTQTAIGGRVRYLLVCW
ncbi:hypothetical protein ACLB1T_02085 [Escherichia coli]